jgi:hypothetical protein
VSTIISKKIAKQISERMLGQVIQLHNVHPELEGKMTLWIVAFRTVDGAGVPSELRCVITGPTTSFDRDSVSSCAEDLCSGSAVDSYFTRFIFGPDDNNWVRFEWQKQCGQKCFICILASGKGVTMQFETEYFDIKQKQAV